MSDYELTANYAEFIKAQYYERKEEPEEKPKIYIPALLMEQAG